MRPKDTLALFDAFLADRHLVLEAVVIGGAALGLLGVVSRQTHDCDILHPELPRSVRDAAREFAVWQRSRGHKLVDDWLNNGPASLADDLPEGWQNRLQPAFSGRAVTLMCLGRVDLLRSKLFALCDRGIDLPDCLALAPTDDELQEIRPGLAERDANPDWPTHVSDTLADLRQRLGHGS
jgi:hypothetical protein